jgi:hypothetical protein
MTVVQYTSRFAVYRIFCLDVKLRLIPTEVNVLRLFNNRSVQNTMQYWDRSNLYYSQDITDVMEETRMR